MEHAVEVLVVNPVKILKHMQFAEYCIRVEIFAGLKFCQAQLPLYCRKI